MGDKMRVLTGREFNEKYVDKKFVKLTNKEEKHNGYEFKSGLNVDTKQFYPYGECQPGGIYFCDWERLPIWLNYNGNRMCYMRLVTIPDDAQVYKEEDKFKADKLILGERQEISELEIWNDREYCAAAVELNGHILKYLQTEEICMAAVKRNGYELQDVRNQTEEICMEAVRQNGLALEYVFDQTEEICLEAVKRNGMALKYVKNQTEEICLEAVRQNGSALECISNQTEEICMEAVKQNGYALEYVKNQTEEICLAAVRQNGTSLYHVRNQTEEICMEAVSQNGFALQYVRIKL